MLHRKPVTEQGGLPRRDTDYLAISRVNRAARALGP
jgi:hypothetical protein